MVYYQELLQKKKLYCTMTYIAFTTADELLITVLGVRQIFDGFQEKILFPKVNFSDYLLNELTLALLKASNALDILSTVSKDKKCKAGIRLAACFCHNEGEWFVLIYQNICCGLWRGSCMLGV